MHRPRRECVQSCLHGTHLLCWVPTTEWQEIGEEEQKKEKHLEEEEEEEEEEREAEEAEEKAGGDSGVENNISQLGHTTRFSRQIYGISSSSSMRS